jgi:hypothetical protein
MLRGEVPKLAKIRCGAVDTAERGRRDVAADQHQVRLQLFHQVELARRAREVAAALRLRHALEVAERLESADGQAEVAAHLADIPRASVEGQKVRFEDLDLVEAGSSDGAEFFVQCA